MKKELTAVKVENAALKRKFAELETSHNDIREDFKRFKQMNENKIDNKFTIAVNGKEFQVNKEILVINSPVLAKMINENPDADRLQLHDITEETFKEILKFMHEKVSPENAPNPLELFAASARLEMKELMDATAEILMDKVTLENAVDIINVSQKYGCEVLHKRACEELQRIVDNL